MKIESLQEEWNELGEKDPLWAILTAAERKGGKWDPETFFATGRDEIAGVVAYLDALPVEVARTRCLDFGCGVGRLTQALAAHFSECDGVDIAPSMVARARAFNRHGDRCRYHVNGRPDLALFEDASFDFVYSNIVLQHMEPDFAKNYLREFLRLLRPGGVALFQVPAENISQLLCDRHRLPAEGFRAAIELTDVPATLRCGEKASLRVMVRNESPVVWPATTPTEWVARIRVGNHWRSRDGRPIGFDDGRSPLPRDVQPGESVDVRLEVTAPASAGHYRLEVDLVQEAVSWFADAGSTPASARVVVRDEPGKAGITSPLSGLRRLLARGGAAAGAEAHDSPDGLGEPPIRMYAIPRDEVTRVVSEAGGVLLDVSPDSFCGPEWISFRYCALRPAPEGAGGATSGRPCTLPVVKDQTDIPGGRSSLSSVDAPAFDRELAQAVRDRLERDLERSERRVERLLAERNEFEARARRAEGFVAAVHASKSWKVLQALRRLVGRGW